MLNIQEEGVYLDATAGGGGHSIEILNRLSKSGRLICTDRDDFAISRLRGTFTDDRVSVRKTSFSGIAAEMAALGIECLDGALFDLGVSAFQLKDTGRGFSFDSDAVLDMRMDSSNALTAWQIVNRYPAREIERILWGYADEKLSRRIAKAIVNYRGKKAIDTCRELAEIISRAYGYRGKTHPATRTFQALRIAVNSEMEELESGLSQVLGLLGTGGRMCVISYHSIEDRIVKHFFKNMAREMALVILTKKPVTPSPEEVCLNPSARSAKLRGAEKL